MGPDLVSACIFCAGMLLGTDLSPRLGLGAEIGFSYATLARRYDVPSSDRVDASDVTPKFILIGIGNARGARDGLGAGTPEFEWRARVAFAPSHDEQQIKAAPGVEPINTDGTGRYENFALVLRLPVGIRDSVEIAANRRNHSATDLINIGGENLEFTEERTLGAERIDLAAGWRHRWPGLEGEAAVRWTRPGGSNNTARVFHRASGALLGGELEVRWRSGGWTALAHGERMSGSLDVHRESFPAFQDRDSSLDASLEAYRLGIGYSWPRAELMLSATYDRQHLPFVALAVLGTETVAFDAGLDPDSIVKQVFWDLAVRYAVTPAIRARVGIRLAWGDETVRLTDSAGVLPDRTLDVARRGTFGGGISGPLGFPEPTLFIGADFSIGAPRP
jgi:hypothetical protein